MFERVFKLFQELQTKTDVIHSKKKADIQITEFDTMNLELIIQDIIKSPDYNYLQQHFPKEIAHKERLLKISGNLVQEVKKMESSKGELVGIGKKESRVFKDYDTKTNKQKRAASLEKFYNRMRNSEVSNGQSSLKNSSSVFLLNKLRANGNHMGRLSRGNSGERNVHKLRRVETRTYNRTDLPPQLFNPKTTTENSLLTSTPYTMTQETTPSSNPQTLQHSKSPFVNSQVSMESSIMPPLRRPTAKFGNTEFPINFHKKHEPSKISHKFNAQQMLNASENINHPQYDPLNSSHNKQKVVESEKVMFVRNSDQPNNIIIKKNLKNPNSKLVPSNFNQLTDSEFMDDRSSGKNHEIVKSKYLNSQNTPSTGLRTMQTTSMNFQPHQNLEYTSINDKMQEFKNLPSDLEIGSNPYNENPLSKPIDLKKENNDQRSEGYSKKDFQEKTKKKKSYQTENPKKKAKKRKSNNVSIQSFQRTHDEHLNQHIQNRKIKTKSTQNFYQKQKFSKKKKMLIPPKAMGRDKKKRRIQNHSLDRSNMSKISTSKVSKNFKKCQKKGKPYSKLKSSNFDNLRTVKDNSSYMMIKDLKKSKKKKKLRTNSFNKSKHSKRTKSRDNTNLRQKSGIKEFEEKIPRKKISNKIRRSSGNLINDITQFSHSGIQHEKTSFIKKKGPAEYKSKVKNDNLNQSRNKNSIMSSRQSTYSKNKHLRDITGDDTSNTEDEEFNIFVKIQNILMNRHTELRNYAYDLKEIQTNSLPKIYIGKPIL